MNKHQYWKKRYEILLSQLEKDEKKLFNKLSLEYDKAYKELEKDIALYYKKYGKHNVIEYRKLYEHLPINDKILLIERMEEFKEKYPQYAHLMPIRESIYKLNRLDGLKCSILMQQYELGIKEEKLTEKHLTKQAISSANLGAMKVGLGNNYYNYNSEIIKDTIKSKWVNGEDFSSRIWKNKKDLVNYLNKEFAQSMARGDSYSRCIKIIKNRLSVGQKNAKRLIYTEGSFVINEAGIKHLENYFKYYEISTVNDKSVCDICNGLQGIKFDIKDREPGINFPPLHANCRCTYILDTDVDFIDKYVANK